MNIKTLKKGCALALIGYFLMAICFYWIAGEQLRVRDDMTMLLTPSVSTGELLPNQTLSQSFCAETDTVTGVSLFFSTFDRVNHCAVNVRILDERENVLGQTTLSASEIPNRAPYYVAFDAPISVRPGMQLRLLLTSPDSAEGNAIGVWYGTTISASRTEVIHTVPTQQKLMMDDIPADGMLSFQAYGQTFLWFGRYYAPIMLCAGLLLAGYLRHLIASAKKGKSTIVLRVISAFQRYGYLMQQLIIRDFKSKYKRSVLGVVWSFLNPLLTMGVQYIVFSTIFRSDIPNFALYLLTGIVCFNFFTEAATMSLQSIVGNASLITKVYVPKYIYPLARVLSSTINLLLSLIPLFAVMLISHGPITPALLLMPFGILCLVGFCTGVGLFLSTAMVFFRDTQFLWGVMSMLWMYATPIFYPESIIPDQFLLLYRCNPLYHIIRFLRTIVIDGISPEPKAYLLCMIASFVPLVVGAIVFKHNQNKFVLNL